jgi:hypothetical protein
MLKFAHHSPQTNNASQEINITPIPQAKNTLAMPAIAAHPLACMPNNVAITPGSNRRKKPMAHALEKRPSPYGKISHR